MKKLLIIAFLALIMNSVDAQPVIYNSIGFKHTPYIQALCTELNIDKNIYILHTDLPVKGYAVKNGFGGYIICINMSKVDYFELREVLAHELYHVRDDILGVWDLETPTTIVTPTRNIYVSEEAKQVELRVKKEGKLLSHKLRKIK